MLNLEHVDPVELKNVKGGCQGMDGAAVGIGKTENE